MEIIKLLCEFYLIIQELEINYHEDHEILAIIFTCDENEEAEHYSDLNSQSRQSTM